MRVSQLIFQTLRTTPGDDRLPGRQLMARAGMLRALNAHETVLLPLGVRARQRIVHIVLSALESAGAQEVALPVASPDALLTAVRGVVQSYRQLPARLYAVGNCGDAAAGGLCADLYGLHAASELDAAYAALGTLLQGIFDRCSVPVVVVEAAGDANGSPGANIFLFPWAAGDVTGLRCPGCGYAALTEAARREIHPPAPEAPLPMEPVATPGCKTIAELAAFLGIPESRTAKAVFLTAEPGAPDERFIFAVVRGDTDLNEAALCSIVGARELLPASEEAVRHAGAEPGYGSPVGLEGVTVIVDRLVAVSPNLVAGANRPGYHLRNVNCGRDFQPAQVADIALARAGDPCPDCGTPLDTLSGVELGSIRRLGEDHAAALGVTYLDQAGAARPLALSHARIYLDRTLGAVAGAHQDEKGLVWPVAAAPFDIYLMTAGKTTPEVSAAAAALEADLSAAGYGVLYDDRDERAGVKFNDADLLGIPVRVVVGERGLGAGMVEVKGRRDGEVQSIALDALPDRLRALMTSI